MFWGLNLKPNRKYSQTTEKSFHISQAALDSESSEGGATQIFISSEKQRFLVCTLRKNVCEQVMLDLNFSEGNEICFQSIGSGNVTLSGYVMEDMADDFMNGDEEEEEDVESGSETEEVDLRNALNAKKATKNKKADKGKVAAKAVKGGADEEEDDEDEDDSDFDMENDDDEEDAEGEEDENDEDDDEDDDEEEEDDEEEDESEDEEVQQPKAKQAKLEKPEKQQNGVAKQKEQQTEKKSKKELKKEKQQQQQQQKAQQPEKPKAGGERVLSGGVKVVDLRVGSGPEAKPGKRTQVFYEGRLLSNNKVFDSLKSGAGFKFSLGRGEVIKGWDVGVVGMKVGGKRRITCPPHMAYGSRGSPPAIPPNSTLVFEVELKGIN